MNGLIQKVPRNIVHRAYEIAHRSNCKDFRHGAVIYKGRRIIKSGYNIGFKTHPNGSGLYSTVHAEVCVITRTKNHFYPDKLDGLKLFVIRLNKAGDIMDSKPCEDCMRLIKVNGLKAYWSERCQTLLD